MDVAVDFLDLDKIADSGQCFRWERLGVGEYRIPAFGRVLTVAQPQPGLVRADCTPEEWRELWAGYFDLDTDYGAIVAAIDPADAYLRAAAQAAWGVRILRQELWETVVSFLISQNNNIPRIKGILARLCATFGGFPSPGQLACCDGAALRAVGLGYRAEYLLDAAGRFLAEGKNGGRACADYQQERLYYQTFRGVGPKVADCICLFGLGYLEAFPVDTWIKRILQDQYRGRFPLECYPRHAGVLQQFMFYYERVRKEKEKGA